MSARLRALDEVAKSLGIIVSICSYCQKVTGTKPVDPGLEGVSHGACTRCHAAVMADLKASRSVA